MWRHIDVQAQSAHNVVLRLILGRDVEQLIFNVKTTLLISTSGNNSFSTSDFNVETMSDFNVETTSDFNVETTSDFNVEKYFGVETTTYFNVETNRMSFQRWSSTLFQLLFGSRQITKIHYIEKSMLKK